MRHRRVLLQWTCGNLSAKMYGYAERLAILRKYWRSEPVSGARMSAALSAGRT